MATQADVLALVAQIKALIGAVVIVVPTPIDEQPVVDALTDLSATIAAKFPPV